MISIQCINMYITHLSLTFKTKVSDGVNYLDNFMQKHLYKRLDTKVSGAIYKML